MCGACAPLRIRPAPRIAHRAVTCATPPPPPHPPLHRACAQDPSYPRSPRVSRRVRHRRHAPASVTPWPQHLRPVPHPSFLRRQEPARPTTDHLTSDIWRRREAPGQAVGKLRRAAARQAAQIPACAGMTESARARGGLKSPTDVREPRLHHLFQRRVEREHPVADFVEPLLRVVDHAVDLHAYRAV